MILLIPLILALTLAAAWAVDSLTPAFLAIASVIALAVWLAEFIHILTKDYSK